MDRPKDRITPPDAASPALPARNASASEVAAFLRQHPDFLVEHPELLETLTPPALQRGERIVDMQQFMVQHQRSEIARLKSQQRALVATSRANLASQARVHTAVLALLAANSFENLIQIVTTDLAVLRQMFAHPLTDKGLDAFLADWAKTGQSILGGPKIEAAAE